MADDLLYHFSDEDDDEDALLDRAFDRWEQLGGGSARGPLFQFHMQAIGRRRRWREVVERAQFNAQLRQLRDPWLSPLLSQQAALCCAGEKRGGTVSSHSMQTHGSASSGLHRH